MTQPLPTLRQLGYLLSLHKHQHFGRAAAASFVSQSALSVGIAELERQLGVLLVDRSRRTIRFTRAGEEMVERAGAILRGAEDLVTAAQATMEPLVGPLRLAVIPTIAPFLLPQILSGLTRVWPRLELFVREMLTTPACEALHHDQVDCVLLALPVECGDVASHEILIDDLLLAARRSEGGTGPVLMENLDAARLLFLEDGHCLTDHALAACKLSEPSRDPRVVASTLHTLVRLVDAGQGITLLPRMAVAAGLLDGTDLIARSIAGVVAERRVALVWRKNHPRTAEFNRLGESIRQIVSH